MDYDNNEHRTKKQKKKHPLFIPIFIGAVIGVILTVIIVPEMLNSNNPMKENTQVEQPKNNEANSFVTVDVTTQVTEVVEEVSPAVVGVTNIQQQADFWSQQDGDEAGTGSGVIYKQEDGSAYVVTNYHVIEGADTVEVVLADETTVEATILGSDLFSDLAVLKMEDDAVTKTVDMGTSNNLKVGEPAIAIGNPLGHMFSGTVTQGVISGTQRTIPLDFNQDGRADWQAEVIQTDAAINPGNSGGALINIEGQLIGINSMKINQASVEGIGFAIPIDTALPIIKELEETGEVTRPYLGVEIYSLEEVPRAEWDRTLHLPADIEGGVYVWSVEPLSPADKAGLDRLDVITKLDGEDVMNTVDLRRILFEEKEIGDDVEITFYRDGNQQEVTVKLGIQN